MREGLVLSLILHAGLLAAASTVVANHLGRDGKGHGPMPALHVQQELLPEEPPHFDPPVLPDVVLPPEETEPDPVVEPPPEIDWTEPPAVEEAPILMIRLKQGLRVPDRAPPPEATPVAHVVPRARKPRPAPRGPTRGPALLNLRESLPDYPRRARELGLEGRVVLRVLVSASGKVTRVEIVESSGHEILDHSVADAAEHWRFRPALRNGVPVAQWYTRGFPFVLQG